MLHMFCNMLHMITIILLNLCIYAFPSLLAWVHLRLVDASLDITILNLSCLSVSLLAVQTNTTTTSRRIGLKISVHMYTFTFDCAHIWIAVCLSSIIWMHTCWALRAVCRAAVCDSVGQRCEWGTLLHSEWLQPQCSQWHHAVSRLRAMSAMLVWIGNMHSPVIMHTHTLFVCLSASRARRLTTTSSWVTIKPVRGNSAHHLRTHTPCAIAIAI